MSIKAVPGKVDGMIMQCDHGCIHLTWGDVSLHFTPVAFGRFAQLVRDARVSVAPTAQQRAQLEIAH